MAKNLYLLAFGYNHQGQPALFTHINQANTGPRYGIPHIRQFKLDGNPKKPMQCESDIITPLDKPIQAMLEYAEENLWPVPSDASASVLIIDDVHYTPYAYHNDVWGQRKQSAMIACASHLLPNAFTAPKGTETHMLPIADINELFAKKQLSQNTATAFRHQLNATGLDESLSLLAVNLFEKSVKNTLFKHLDDIFIHPPTPLKPEDDIKAASTFSQKKWDYCNCLFDYLNNSYSGNNPTEEEHLKSCRFLTGLFDEYTAIASVYPKQREPYLVISQPHAKAFNQALLLTAKKHNKSAPPTIKVLP